MHHCGHEAQLLKFELVCWDGLRQTVQEVIYDVLETPVLQEFGGPVLFEFFGVLVGGPILNFRQNMRVHLSTLILKADQEYTVCKVFRVLHQSLYDFVLV